MNHLAIDIALLPPQEIMEAAIELNRKLLQHFEPKIVLNGSDCLPHLSLAMGGLKEGAIASAAGILVEIASQLPPALLIFTGIDVGRLATGEEVSTLEVEKTPSLQTLHETVMGRLAPFLSGKTTAASFIGDPAVHTESVEWVNRYRTAAAFDRFSPHITIGIGKLREGERLRIPSSGTVSRLALCHLGDYCTCRKILFETELKGEGQEGTFTGRL